MVPAVGLFVGNLVCMCLSLVQSATNRQKARMKTMLSVNAVSEVRIRFLEISQQPTLRSPTREEPDAAQASWPWCSAASISFLVSLIDRMSRDKNRKSSILGCWNIGKSLHQPSTAMP